MVKRNRMLWVLAAVILAGGRLANAQNESALRRAFEGMPVTVKMDMPASSEGVELRPEAGQPIDYRKVGNLIRSAGIGLHRGETTTVTKIVVKEHHIEVQLGGGGYGTFADALSTPSTPYVPYEAKSRHQRDLEEELRYTYGSRDRRELKDEIDRENRERARDNTMAAAVNAQATAANQATVAAKRAQSGSRFNIRYDAGFPPGALTAESVRDALRPYLDFGGGRSEQRAGVSASSTDRNAALRKGLTVMQVEQILGPAARVDSRTEGSIDTNVREYNTDSEHVSCQFVGGVLVNYQVTPRR